MKITVYIVMMILMTIATDVANTVAAIKCWTIDRVRALYIVALLVVFNCAMVSLSMILF